MDTFENDRMEGEWNQEHTLHDVPDKEEPAQEQAAQTQQNEPVARKESPFADSPYVMEHLHHQETISGGEKAPRRKKARAAHRKPWKGIVAAVLVLALMGGTCAATVVSVNNSWDKKWTAMNLEMQEKMDALQERLETAETRLNTASQSSGGIVSQVSASNGNLTPSQVYERNVNSVVAISNQATTNVYGQITQTASSGSGFIISEDGYVVSNYHVVEGATTLTVITYDGTEYPATLIGYDESNDVSLLKIDATGLTPAILGSSSDLVVGDQVVAIGNPLGELTSTLTVGYISAKDRTISTDGTYINMMQTDAAINSGNSGGPLFNMNGEVVGITTAKYSGSTNSGATIEGIGFAIPIDDVAGMLDDLRQYGYVTGAYLGVSVQSMDASVADAYGLPVGSKVATVESGSCAEKGGVQVGDIITALNGSEVTGNSDLLLLLRKHKAGETVTLSVYRAGRELDLTVTLDEKPAPVDTQTETDSTDENGGQSDQMPSQDELEEWFRKFFGGR